MAGRWLEYAGVKGAAELRFYVSFPNVEIGEGRPRVPSRCALAGWRARTARVPSADIRGA